jgi:hypothetical protein
MPREKRDRSERLDELHGFLHQSHISVKNLNRLEILGGHSEPEIATLARLIQDVARVLPGKRSRWLKLAQRHRPLFDRAVTVLGVEYFEELLAGYGDFDSPLWKVLETARKSNIEAYSDGPEVALPNASRHTEL